MHLQAVCLPVKSRDCFIIYYQPLFLRKLPYQECLLRFSKAVVSCEVDQGKGLFRL